VTTIYGHNPTIGNESQAAILEVDQNPRFQAIFGQP